MINKIFCFVFAEKNKFEEKATEISENEMGQLIKQMELFKKNLEEFAFKYKNEIKGNSQFRKQFQDMCANIGVDPLSSSKGFWSEMLVRINVERLLIIHVLMIDSK
jgi:ESCRT-II complex subunit VPS22